MIGLGLIYVKNPGETRVPETRSQGGLASS